MLHANWFSLIATVTELRYYKTKSNSYKLFISVIPVVLKKKRKKNGNLRSPNAFPQQFQVSQHQWRSPEFRIQSDLCRHDSDKVHLITWLKVRMRRQKSTRRENRSETLELWSRPTSRSGKVPSVCVLGGGRCGKVESWSSAVKAVMNSVYE